MILYKNLHIRVDYKNYYRGDKELAIQSNLVVLDNIIDNVGDCEIINIINDNHVSFIYDHIKYGCRHKMDFEYYLNKHNSVIYYTNEFDKYPTYFDMSISSISFKEWHIENIKRKKCHIL